MSDNTTISAEQRERVGKGSARAVRRAGRVPAVYAVQVESLPSFMATKRNHWASP